MAVLTLLAVALLGVEIQTDGSFAALLSREDVAQQRTVPEATTAADGTLERTVLAVERKSAGPEPATRESRQGVSGETTDRASEEPDQPKVPAASEEPLNVLILGVDRRPSAAEGSSSRSDTMMLAQVDPETGRVELLSVPRDLLVEVEPGVEDRINTAYTYGGVEQAKAVMEGVTGVPIDAHAIMDFKGFEQVIDAVGGVRVDVEDGIPPKYEIRDGPQTLNGEQALFYARYRKTAGGDLDRIEHQQKMLAALRGKILSWNTVTELPTMLRIANDNVDTDLGLFGAVSLGRGLASNGDEGDLQTVQLKGYPETLPGGAQVLVPDYEANEAILADFRE